MLLIHIFERPVWTFTVTGDNWKDGNIYPSFQLPYLPYLASTLLIAACLVVLWFCVFLEFGYKRTTQYSHLTLLFAAVLALKSIAIFVYIINVSIDRDPVFSTSPVEALCILLVEYKYESNMGYLFRTMPKFTLLLLVLSSIICTYTALGFLIFDPSSSEAKQYFNFYGSAVWNMLMVLNGSNWPTPMMPAFTQNRLYCLYFFIYIIIVQWGLLNLVLGFVYLFFKLEQRQISASLEVIRESHFDSAFQILDVEEKGFLNYSQVDTLLEELFVHYEDTITLLPTAEERYELILLLDEQSNMVIDEKDFNNLEVKCFGDALKVLRSNKVKFNRYLHASAVTGQNNTLMGGSERSPSFFGQTVSPFISRQNTLVPRMPTVQENRPSDLDAVTNKDLAFQRAISEASVYGKFNSSQLIDRFRTIETLQNLKKRETWWDKMMAYVVSYKSYMAMQIDAVTYDIVLDSIIFVLGILFLVLTEAKASEVLFSLYLGFASFELLTKWLVKGTFRCYKSKRQSIDFLLTLLLYLVLIIHLATHRHSTYHNNFGSKACILFRCFLFPRNIICTEYFKAFRHRHRIAFHHAIKGANHFSFLLLVLFAVMYGFAALGQQAFGGTIMKTGHFGKLLNNDIYGQSGYWPLNFNDMPSGFVTMFVLLHVNNMHITTSGMVAVDGQWSELFFAAFYAFGVLYLLNVLTAVFLNEFMGYLEKVAVERRKAAALAVISRMLTVEQEKLAAANGQHNPDLSMGSHVSSDGSESYVGMSAINQSLLLQLERDQHKANQDTEQSGNKRTLIERLFGWHTPVKGDPKSESVTSNSRQNMSALFSSRSEDSNHDSYVSSINNSMHFGSSYNRPIQKIIRPVQPSPAEIVRQELDNDRASRFSKSIFESSSGRKKLESWISRYYPKSLTGKRRGSGTSRPTVTGNISLHEILIDNPLTSSSVAGAEILASEDSDTNSGDNLLHRSKVASPESKNDSRLSELQSEKKGVTLGTGSTKKRRSKKRSADKEPLVIGSPNTERRKSAALSLFTAATSAEEDSDSSDEDPDMDIVVDINANGPEFKDTEDSLSLSNVIAAAGTGDDDSVVPPSDKEVDELEMNTDFNARSLSVNIQREKNILKHLSARNIAPRKPKTSLLHWMYGNNQLSPHERAAVLIQFAREGDEHSIFSSERALACYRMRSRLAQLFRLTSFVYALLKFFERPVWTYHKSDWGNNAYFPMSGLPFLTTNAAIGIKIPLLCIMLFGLCLELGYKESDLTTLYSDLTPMRVCRCLLTLYCVVQILILFSCIGLSGSSLELVSMTSAGSILYVLWFNRRSLSKFKIVLRVIPKLSIVLLAFLCCVLIFGGFGPFIFHEENSKDDDANAEYFGTFGDSSWSVFVAITSSDYPNQVMPAYSKAREVFLYFFAFICVGAYGFLNIIIIIVLVQFQKATQLHNDYQKASRHILLMRAFEILDQDGKGYLEKGDVKLLLDELYLHYSDFQKAGIPQQSARRILIDILDIDGDGKISVDDFLFFLDVTRIKLCLDSRKTFVETHFPFVANSIPFQLLRSLVGWKLYDLFLDGLAVFLIVVSLIVTRGHTYDASLFTRKITIVVMAIYVWEALSKLLVRGYANYIRSFRNKVDITVTIPMFLLLIADLCYSSNDTNVNGFTISVRILQTIRVIIFPRNIRYLMYARGILKLTKLLRRVLAKIYTLGLVFLCIGYVFASVGVFAYGGLIDRSPTSENYEDLNNSAYGKNGFWGLNFNDLMSGCITLFTCLHVSDFDVITNGMTTATDDWSRLYFTAWYVIGVLLMLNIVKAFFLSEFLGLFQGAKDALHEPNADDDKNNEKSPSTKNNAEMKKRLINRLNKGQKAPIVEGSSDGSHAYDSDGRSSVSNSDSALISNPMSAPGSTTSSAQSVFHITRAVQPTTKDRTFSNMSASSTSSISNNAILRPVSAARPIEHKEDLESGGKGKSVSRHGSKQSNIELNQGR